MTMLQMHTNADNLELDIRKRGLVAQFVIWFLFIASVFSVCARMGTKFVMRRAFGLDDVLILTGQLFYVAQCATISKAVSTAFNPNSSTISGETLTLFLKLDYASISFLILALALVKWSAHEVVRQLSPVSYHHRTAASLSILVGLWLVTAIGANLFQCALPKPWDYVHSSRCIDRKAWWTYVTVVNLLTELILVGLYIIMFGNLRMSLPRKAAIIAAFSTRLVVVGITSVQLAVFRSSTQDPVHVQGSWLILALNQGIISSSVITACIPHLKPFMQNLQSGVMQVGHTSDGDMLIQPSLAPPSSGSYELSRGLGERGGM
ncbi:hypothetical protein F4678DRAFT_412104 [Xylaria arbuscula]|nr:hypothetical protein F4678DRAFT_412104 [Xylaria arbuscula]